MGQHSSQAGRPEGVFILLGTLLAISLSLNAVFIVLNNWNLVPN